MISKRIYKRSTYRDDGNKNASETEHGIAYGVSVFIRIPDGLVTAVKPALIRLDHASFN